MSVARDAGVRPAQPYLAAVPSKPAAQPGAAPAPQAADGADPRSLAALTRALSSFLAEINAAPQAGYAAADMRAATTAYAEAAEAAGPAAASAQSDAAQPGATQPVAALPGAAQPAGVQPAATGPFEKALSALKEDFDGLIYTMQSAANPADAAGAAERTGRMKAGVANFVASLNTMADAIGRANQPPAVSASDASPTGSWLAAGAAGQAARQQPAAPAPQAADSRGYERPSLFASLASRVNRHFEEL